MSHTREPRQWQQTFCPHCEETATKSSYYRHREKCYDVRLGVWSKSSDDTFTDTSGSSRVDTAVPGFHVSSASESDEEGHCSGGSRILEREVPPEAAQAAERLI